MKVIKVVELYRVGHKPSLERYANCNKIYNVLGNSRRYKRVFNKRYMKIIRHVIFKNRFIHLKPGSDFSMYNRLNYSSRSGPGEVQINRAFSMRMIKRKRVGKLDRQVRRTRIRKKIIPLYKIRYN